MKKLSIAILLLSVNFAAAQLLYQDPDAEKGKVALIYGEHHLFSVMTPDGWVINKPYAKLHGLASFFYPEYAINKSDVYLYAMGFDKSSPDDTISNFIKTDIRNMKIKYKKLKTKELKANIRIVGPLLTVKIYNFLYNDSIRYGDQIIYIETKRSILTLVFSANTKSNYDTYFGSFDKFMSSFEYLGENENKIGQ